MHTFLSERMCTSISSDCQTKMRPHMRKFIECIAGPLKSNRTGANTNYHNNQDQ